MTTQALSIKCPRCSGTGIDSNVSPAISCTNCGGDGYIENALLDTTEISGKIDALQLSIDQVAQIVKEDSEYIRKIYEIVSK